MRTPDPRRPVRLHRTPLSLLIAALFLPLPSRPQVVADPTAAPHERPVIHSTASGLPQVDITAPTAAGVSVNRFTQFDVGAPGAIVNNGRSASATALAGWVAANPALLASPARVIVGEVRGPLSQLNGFVEIAGSKADFILANPAGITCDGCGFLNAQRVELATGTPVWGALGTGGGLGPGQAAGQLPGTLPSTIAGGPTAYRLGPGAVRIDGAGLDARNTSAAAILTQAAAINAGLWAQYLQLSLGRSAAAAPTAEPISPQSTSSQSTSSQPTSSQPTSSASTSSASAATTAPPLPTSTTASLSAEPSPTSSIPPPSFALELSALGLVSARGITLVGTAEGLGARNFGTLAAAERLQLSVDGKLVNAGTLDAQQLSIDARQGIDNLAHGRILGQQVALATDRLANAGHPDASPVIAATERLDLGVRVLENTDGALIFSAGDLAIGGHLDEQRRASGQAASVLNRAATIEALGHARIATATLHNANGGGVIDERPLGQPTPLSLLQPDGSSERYLRELFRFEGWSRAGQYRWKTDATRIDEGVLGKTPIPAVSSEDCNDDGTQCTATPGSAYPASDPAWAYFTLTPPDPPLPPAGAAPTPPTLAKPQPVPENTPADDPARQAYQQQQARYDAAWQDYHAQQARHAQAVAAVERWQTVTDDRYDALDAAIAAYNAGFTQQLIRSWTQFEVTRSQYQSVVTASAPGRIVAGGDLTLEGTTLVNDRSQMMAGGKLSGTLDKLTQIDALGTRRVTETGTSQFTRSRWRGGFKRYHQRDWGPVLPYAPADVLTTIVLPVTVTREQASDSERGAAALDAANARLTAEGLALWQVNPAPGSGPVFVTDARFTRYRDWMSSTYMLERLQADPAGLAQRLGDGFIEQRLVREQIAQLTGRRWLPGQTDDEARYAQLIHSGVQYAQTLSLRPGVALTAGQVSQLTSDLVWLVEREVTLPDGRVQRVLVPQVYLRPRPGDLAGDGTLIAGQTVELLVREALENAGTIAAQEALVIDAGRIHHSGTLAGDTVAARTDGDLVIDGGTVVAREAATVAAGRDLVLQSTTNTTERTLRTRSGSRSVSGLRSRTSRSTAQRTTLDRVASVHVGGSGGRPSLSSSDPENGAGPGALTLAAGRDVVINAAQVTHTGSGPTVVAAGRDLQLGTVTTESRVAAEGHDARNFQRDGLRTDIGTQIRTQGDVVVAAGQDVSAKAATVASQHGALTVEAGRDVQLASGQQSVEQAQGSFFKRSSTFGSTRTTTRTEFERTDVLGSALSAASVMIDAGRDVALSGSTVVADGLTSVNAAEALALGTATATTRQSEFRQTIRSGLMGSGGIGVTVGRQRVTGENETVTATDVGSAIGSLNGNVTLAAGSTLTQTAGSVLAPEGDIVMTAPAIGIEAGVRQQTSTQQQEVKQSGLTIAVSNPVLAAVQTARQMAQAAARAPDRRIQALAAANTALAAGEAVQAVQAGQGTTINGQPNQIATGTDAAGKPTSRDANAFDKVGGVQASVSVGSSRSNSQTTTITNEALPSAVAAGGDVTIAAIAATDKGKNTTPAAGNAARTGGALAEAKEAADGQLTVRGSRIAAGDTARLVASGNLQLEAAANTQTQQSTNRASSGSIGVVIDSRQQGVGVQVAGSRARGRADGASQSWTETTVTAGTQAQLASGKDTTLSGGIVAAPQVTANVGADLTITSLQDTDTYTSRQQQIGGSVIVGPASSGNVNASGSRIDSTYASVNEVSGIKAGDAGFDVTVQGNAALTGSVLASSEAAVDANRNRLQVGGSMTTTDVANGARYAASGYGVNLGTAVSPQGGWVPAGTGVGLGHDGDAIDSLTRAGISGIAGDTTVRSHDAPAPLPKIFDAASVQSYINAQVQITQEFSARAPRAVAAYADGQVKAINAQLQQLPADGDDDRRAQLLAEKQQWVEGGRYRVALHAAVGGLAGGSQGAAGAGISAALVPELARALDQTDLPAAIKSSVLAGAGTLLGAAVGGNAGAATALGETANNFLTHPEARQREAAHQRLIECRDDSCRQQARQEIARLDTLDQWRDQQVAAACLSPASALCQGWHAALSEARHSYASFTARDDLTHSVAAERRQVNEQEYLYRQRIADPFAYGVAKGLMKLTPPAVVLGLGLTSYELTKAIIDVGLAETAVAIGRGLAGLPAELSARLNSDDPAVRGEALVDTLAITSASTVIVGRLQQSGSTALTKALEQQAALQAQARAIAKAKTENNVYRDGSNIEYGRSIVSTNPDEAVFWSGKTHGIGGEKTAAEIAEKYRGLTLEQVIERRQLHLPEFNRGDRASVEAWTRISYELAKNAKGEVKVVLGELVREDSIWKTVELPALKSNPSVTRIISIDPATRVEKVIFERGKK